MATVNEKMTAIADAIRSKTGKENKLTLEDMANEIENLKNEDAMVVQLEDGCITECANNNVTSIKKKCFMNWNFLERVSFPNASSVGDSSFNGCVALKEIYMPNLTQCAIMAFQNCQSLETVDFPKCVEGSTQDAFARCINLKHINLPLIKILYSNAFTGCSSLEEVFFPSVTTLYGYAFSECSNLKKADFNNLFTFFKERAFFYCTSLDTLILRFKSHPVSLSNINNFENTPRANGTGYIYVPKALIEDYKVATNWIAFADQFRAIEDYPEICGGITS